MSGYEEDLQRFLDDWELHKRDAQISEENQRRREEAAVKRSVAILVEQGGYSEQDALDYIKSTGRFRKYFKPDSE